MKLAEIWIHPVKSLGGMRVPRAEVDDRGLRGDRRFMVVDASGRMVTQREHASMASVHARIEGGSLVLNEELSIPIDVEGPTREVSVWNDLVEAIDAGDEAARFLSGALAIDVRLVRMPQTTHRRVDERYARGGDLVSFADGFPFLLVTDGSLRALNERLDRKIDARRFRPNLVIEGAAPFAEETWSELAIGPIRFFVAKHCSRCQIVNVDPDTAVRGAEPLAALADLNKREHKVWFGENLLAEGYGEIAVGDDVVLLRDSL